MSERQYIGARYVPIFADPLEWDNSRSYAPLTIVTHLGTSYTSKKAVPVGIDITNSNYWVATGNYNAQVEAYRQLTEQLANEVAELTQEKYLLIGDSYGVTNSDRPTSWCTYLEQYLGLTVARIGDTITSDTDCVELCVGGAGFIGLSGAPNWLDYVQQNYPEDYDKNKVTKIIIAGGLNDYSYDSNTITLAIRSFANYVSATFPNAKVYLFCCGAKLDAATNLTTVLQSYEACRQYKQWVYCTGLEGTLHNTYYMNTTRSGGQPDYSHPNDRGSVALARGIKNIMQLGNDIPIEVSDYLTLHTGSDYNVTANRTVILRSGVRNVQAFLYPLYSIRFNFSTALTIDESNEVILGTISNSYFRNNNTAHGSTNIVEMTKVVEGENVKQLVPIKITIDKDGVVRLGINANEYQGDYVSFSLPAYLQFIQNIYID